MQPRQDDFHGQLPSGLTEPHYYLSALQADVIQRRVPGLAGYLEFLPCWVPHRRVADALGYSDEGLRIAVEFTGDRPYVWATEFENVHTFWRFDEAEVVVDGTTYRCVETYYHAQKPRPFDPDIWKARRVDVMRRGLLEKFRDAELLRLLRSTSPHPLVSIKPDRFWGVDPTNGGENMLGRLLEQIR